MQILDQITFSGKQNYLTNFLTEFFDKKFSNDFFYQTLTTGCFTFW